MISSRFAWCLVACACAFSAPLNAQLVGDPNWRALGPANMSGRIVDIAVHPTDRDLWYVASASGGLFKTTNAGTTWTPVFDQEATVSLGAVAIAPSAPDTVWIGTGEPNARNSVSWGDGLYVSRDAGKTFQHAGLRESFQIGAIAVHPTEPDTVLVAACGRLWGPNTERGIFRTTDGGKSWAHALAIDADTGAVDVLFDPADPSRAFAASWTRRRGAYDANDPVVRFGAGAGLWRSTDGGYTWARLGSGLPTCAMGRVGLAISPSQPRTLYAVIATERIGEDPAAAADAKDRHPHASFLGGQKANVQAEQGEAGFETGGVFRSDDGGDTWRRVNSLDPRPYYYSEIRVDPKDAERVYILGPNYFVSTDGGKVFDEIRDHRLHVDFHALWIDPDDPENLLLGGDGGLARSRDRGTTWRFFSNLPCGQFYRVAVDDQEPYRIFGGLQDNGSWMLPSRTRFSDGIRIGDVVNIGWGDGFTALPHPKDPDLVFCSSQYGAISARDLRTGKSSGVARPKTDDDEKLRFQWDTPFAIAAHEPDVLWVGAQRLIRATARGEKAEFASPVLAATDTGAITSIALSTKSKGTIWVGTADGRVWLTKSAGRSWKDTSDGFSDLPGAFHVSDVEASRTNASTAWVSFDGHRSDDFGVHLYRTTNAGRTFARIGDGIERGPVLALQQGAANDDLLFAGTEFGVFASLDGGDSFAPLRGNLPTVAVRDFALQARDRELVAATHGRGLFVLDVAGLEALTKKVRARSLALLEPVHAVDWVRNPHRLVYGDDAWNIPNPERAAAIHYWVGGQGAPPLSIEIAEKGGAAIRKLDAPNGPGLHRVTWDLRRTNDKGQPGPDVGLGIYTVSLRTETAALEQRLEVVADPQTVTK